MKGDYYRYLSEVASEDEKKSGVFSSSIWEACTAIGISSLVGVVEKAAEAYEKAQESASGLPSTHPIRLGLALNFSVFYYEIDGSHDKACALAKKVLATVFVIWTSFIFLRLSIRHLMKRLLNWTP